MLQLQELRITEDFQYVFQGLQYLSLMRQDFILIIGLLELPRCILML